MALSYKKYILLGLGGGLVSLILSLMTHPLVGFLGLMAFMVLMARSEDQAYKKIRTLMGLIEDLGLETEEATQLTGYSKEDLALLDLTSQAFPLDEKKLDRALLALEKFKKEGP
ncbi:MAG: hypothetical protein Q4E37_03595 [Tissierellia bacterium]|nr:hypothetical protein [Tissierellia bacterium]